MIPARIGRNQKKNFTIPNGVYEGFWQDYFCWLYTDTTITFRFDTATKAIKRGEKVVVKVDYCNIYIYEKLKSNQL